MIQVEPQGNFFVYLRLWNQFFGRGRPFLWIEICIVRRLRLFMQRKRFVGEGRLLVREGLCLGI